MSTALKTFTKVFEGKRLTTIMYKEKLWWIAREVGAAWNYGRDGKNFVDLIGGEWADEFDDADRWQAHGDELKAILKIMNEQLGLGGYYPPTLLLLSQTGINKAALLSRKPEGQRLRDWLAKEVLPEIQQTGAYAQEPLPQPPQTTAELLLVNVKLLLGVTEVTVQHEKRLTLHDKRLTNAEAAIARLEASGQPSLDTRALQEALHLVDCQQHDLAHDVKEQGQRLQAVVAEACQPDPQFMSPARLITPPGRRPRARSAGRKMTLTADELRKLYVDERLSMELIAVQVGCSREEVRKAIRAAGIPARQRGTTSRSDLTPDQMKRLYQAGYTLAEIGHIAGIGHPTVRARLVAMGVEMRRKGVRGPRIPN